MANGDVHTDDQITVTFAKCKRSSKAIRRQINCSRQYKIDLPAQISHKFTLGIIMTVPVQLPTLTSSYVPSDIKTLGLFYVSV